MADSEVLKRLKDIPFKIQTASLKGRRDVLEDIQDVLSTPGITEPAVRFVCRVLGSTLHRYRDATSQSYVKDLLAYLATNHREWTLRSFLPVLLDISEQLKNISTSKSISQSGLYALRWSTVLVNNSLTAKEEDDVDYKSLVLSQANLLAVVTAYGNKRKNDKAYSMLHTSWCAIGSKLGKWLEVLVAQAADSGPHVCVAFSALCRHYKQVGDEQTISQHKAKMLESFIKSLISVKCRPNSNYIKGCWDLLHMLDCNEVHEKLLPALHKAMLRSPETIIQAVGEVIANLDVDLDGIAVDIGKSLIGNLHSREPWVRSEAAAALERLAVRCAAASAARALLDHAFAEYHGAGGNLTSSEDKAALLNGVGVLSSVRVPAEERAQLASVASTQLARVLAHESHDRTLCAALRPLRLWTRAHAPRTLPPHLADLLQVPTSAVRVARVARPHAVRRAAPAAAVDARARPAHAAAAPRRPAPGTDLRRTSRTSRTTARCAPRCARCGCGRARTPRARCRRTSPTCSRYRPPPYESHESHDRTLCAALRPLRLWTRAHAPRTLPPHLADLLQSHESHDRTLCAALRPLRLWTRAHAPRTLPPHLADLLQKNLSAKNTPQVVRTAYASLLAHVVRDVGGGGGGGGDAGAGALKPLLLAALDKAAHQPLQHLVVSEGISALASLVLVDRASSSELVARPALLPALLHDRVLAAACDDVLIQVVLLCRTVLEDYPSVASEQNSPIYRAFTLVMLSPVKPVRTTAIEEVKSLLAKEDRALLARYLVLKLNEVLEEGKIFSNKEKSPPEEKGSDVTGKMILDCVQALCSFRDYPVVDAQSLAIDALPSCHHPLVVAIDRRAWVKLVCNLQLEPKKLVGQYANNLKNTYIVGYTPNETLSNVVSTLAGINTEVIASSAIQGALNTFQDRALLRVTRDEYFTYLTPEGELYDKSSVPGNEDNKEMNMKRESKAYSYKDQLEELQLRRELEEKRRKQGKVKEVPLTAKQKEAIKAQLAKESAIRQRLSVLEARVSAATGLVAATQRGAVGAVRTAARRLVSGVLAALRSPLAAPQLAPLYCALRPALLPLPAHRPLAALLAAVTLRLHKPQCDLDPSWEEEPLEKATIRTINLLHAATEIKDIVDDAGVPVQNDNHFTAPGFCYVFPLLKEGLTASATRKDESTMVNGLTVITRHVMLRSDDEMLQPELFPIDHMFRLLIDLISSTSGRVQAECTVALLESARCSARGHVAAGDVHCLLAGLQDPLQVVRDAALRALLWVVDCLPPLLEHPHNATNLTKRLLIATFDVSEDNKKLACELWSKVPLAQEWSREEAVLELVLADVEHPAEQLQRAAAAALADLLQRHHPAAGPRVLRRLQDVYLDNLPMIPARLDQFGHVVEAATDAWGSRRGAALALRALAPQLEAAHVEDAMRFFVERALADRDERVRADMLDAAMAIVDLHGKETLSSQLPVFENFLDKAPKSGGYDAVRSDGQKVVLLVGSQLHRQITCRLLKIKLKMLGVLSTPSQQVQEAVSNCLPHLVSSPALEEEVPAIMNKLMKQLLTAEKYGDRKGAAYGIAGIIKGLGILSLKQLDVMGKLTEAIQEKKNYKYREGALFGFEMLCYKLGRLFEPYIVHVLPHLLLCFGDSSQYVRAAADDTAKLIMSKLSAHGVKLVLPSLLQALQDDNWRTKAGSIELLGAMAYCAPKQLSSCLPSIVPKLIEVLSDSHMRVQEAGAEALKVIGSVIRNPEIQAIVPVLLCALQDPSNKTSACLQTLLDTKFVHFIDAPSLALIMPVVQRAFLDRSTETRKMAAQIIGNMYSLTDQKDLMPYLPNIIPGLKNSLLDPVPEVRSVSARALGAMVKGMGESSFEELLPWLMHTLTSESSSVDRSGAAQGLSEVVAGLGVQKLHKIMPDIIATAERTDIAPHVKDGYIMMFIYMPGAFTDEFTPYIGQIINPILKALADENEYVRETALKAGQRIVNLYAETAITLLLPELERGLFDDNWRIRYSSVQLLGDLLYRISGVSGKMSTETASEDDNFGTEHSHKAIMSALGSERRNRVLAGLYMGRSDVALMVRQAALHVWKVVVTNTPKTLREILPTLFTLLLGCLASTSFDKRQVAARTLGDLVRKQLGERVLPEIIPILERGMRSDRADQRQGVCIGLSEILNSTSRDAVNNFADGLIPTVRAALCDPLPEVRQAAARTFDSLQGTVGTKALDDILPHMLRALNDPDRDVADASLDGLKQIMSLKSRAVLPYLVPVLTAGGAGGVDTHALSALAAAAGGALGRHLPRVLPALLSALVAARGRVDEPRELDHCRDALLPVTEAGGVRCIVDTLLEASRGGAGGAGAAAAAGGAAAAGAAGGAEGGRRRAASVLLCAYVSHTRADLAPHVPQLLRGLLLLFADSERDVLQMAWEALAALTKTLDAEHQILHVHDVRQAVRYAAADLRQDLLPGFCLPKGIAPILPLFRESILNGLPEDKENAALMLGEVIKLTSPAAIQPSVVHITGPLIRILGDRFNSSVKAAVLETLALLLSKVGVMLKQFLPQLQTTFLKALHDPNRAVRIKAGLALSQLVVIHTRADPLFVEMHNGIKNAEDPAIRETMLQALRSIITRGGDKVSEQLALGILGTLSGPALLAHADDPPRAAVGGCLGALLHCLPPAHRDAALLHHVLAPAPAPAAPDDWLLQHGRSCALFVALKETPHHVYRDPFQEKIERALLGYLASDRTPLACNAIRGMAYLMRHLLQDDRPLPPNILSQFVRSMNHPSNEVKQLMASASAVVGREAAAEGNGGELLRALLPALVNGTKEKNTYVRANSELALRHVLRLPHDERFHQQCAALLEEGAREALADVVARVLRRAHSDARDDHNLDCTLLT
ncbi:LOW QUALITY PROTEIN: stalled ribosome sensor GCN1 [Achroia grisella]|uniref:LOW QUALITY PROTEIN: stalled ribosome sensor GCN1 n=1 Tax=Achroia grisella TaxID=688607 RepID=UPI0027D283C1|nr:LOW QUALITY PROTEIN: stalled ribosome sensor GCN1 [Achroia grisella]